MSKRMVKKSLLAPLLLIAGLLQLYGNVRMVRDIDTYSGWSAVCRE
jgi:hypothetical protein